MLKRKVILLSVAIFIAACQNQDEVTTESDPVESEKQEVVKEVSAIKLYPKEELKAFPNATLLLEQPMNESHLVGPDVAFDFMVEEYQLGEQTLDARMDLANSAKGQHIHLIIDNDPYSAHYDAGFSKEIADGQHYAIAFLSRSYHESVKNPSAYQVFQFSVGTSEESPIDLNQPALFYSRPKGTYSGKDTEKVLLDFYLHNVSLAADGNKVRVRINDKEEFLIDKWQAYIIEGLPLGENKIDIELIDADGLTLDIPINSISRTFNLEE